MLDRELAALKRADPAGSLADADPPKDVLAAILATERRVQRGRPRRILGSRRRLSFAAAALAVACAAAAAVVLTGGSDPVTAKLPVRLEKALASPVGDVRPDLDKASKVVLPDGSDAWIVPGEDGGTCIGTDDGSKACETEPEVAAGQLELFQLPRDTGPVTPTSSASVTLLGYNPEAGITEATVLGPDDEVLGKAPLVDGVYKITVEGVTITRRPDRIRYTGPTASTTVPL